MNHYRIEGPAVISFSGGRTSAYLLRRILDVGLEPDVHVVFANTGKERNETLDFVREVSVRWDIEVTWLERNRTGVTYETASRNGEPFEELITQRKFLPNTVMRFCTQELKVRQISKHMQSLGYDHWLNVLGIRADEPRRVAKISAGSTSFYENVLPLARDGVSEADVLAYWKASPFDLQLNPGEGNCDLCYLKTTALRASLIRSRPESAKWWIEQEQRIGARFRKDTITYEQILSQVQSSPMLSFDPNEPSIGDCICHD